MSTTRSRNFKSLNAESHTSDTIDVDKDDDSEVSGESLDHFGSKDSEEYSSDDSIGDELAKYYHDDNLLSPKYQTLLAPKHKFSPTNAASLGPSSANKHSHTDASHVSPPTLTTFSLTEAVTDSTTTPAAAPLSLSLPPSPVIPPRKLKNKHKKRQQEEEDDDDDASDDGAAKESLTQVQVRKYFGSEARETFHKKVNWLNRQGAAAKSRSTPKPSTRSRQRRTQQQRANRNNLSNLSNKSSSRSRQPLMGRNGASTKRGLHESQSLDLPALRADEVTALPPVITSSAKREHLSSAGAGGHQEHRNSFSAMFFDDMNDLDSSHYVNVLETDTETDGVSDVDQLSTQEFIQRSKRALKQKKHAGSDSHNITSSGSSDLPAHSNPNKALLTYANRRTAASMRKIESLRAATPDLYTLPSEGKGLTKLDSPRSSYIVGCLAQQLNPRASLVIRKDLTHEFQLAGMGMGDKMAVEFARSIRQIPVVHRINVEDNNLTDKGLKAILESITTLPNLLELNMSSNKIGMQAAKALQSYLQNTHTCRLGKLILRNAHVDDFEILYHAQGEMFVTALKGSRHLKELDLSKNLIGQSEMTVRRANSRGAQTATRAIADHLTSPDCCLEILKLSWNSIRLDSGVSLAKAIAHNTSLRILDLSYNAIGSDGGQIIGQSLYDNRTMERLILANNNIDAEACFVICAATEHNFTLQYLCLDGNPIGEMGAKSIMNIPSIIGSRCEISCLGCNTGLRAKAGMFDEIEPFGMYDLDMSVPYQRAVACRVLSIVCCNRTYHLPTCIVSPTPIKGNEPQLQLEQKFIRDRILYATKKDKKRIKMLHRLRVAATDIEKATELFNEFDIDHSGMIDKHEFQLLLQSIGITTNQSIIEKCMFLVDVDGSGQIELNECIAFFQASAKDAEKKINEMIETSAMCVKDPSGAYVRYVPPSSGFMRIGIDRGHSRKPVFQVITASDQINIIKLANKLGDVTTMIRYALQHTKLRLPEAISFYDVMLIDNGDKIKIMHYLLPRMLLPSEAQQLISHITLENPGDISYLRQSMGNAIRPILGTPCGYYTLDLSKDMDRVCLHRLMEISATANLIRIQEKTDVYTKGCYRDTSMHGNFSFFRNEYFNGSATVICPANFIPLPSRGLLEFDFAGDFRPLLSEHGNTISDQKITKILINVALLSIEDKDRNLDWLDEMSRLTEPLVTATPGFDKYKTTLSKLSMASAKEIQEAQTLFYSKLPERKEYLKLKAKKEEIKVDYHIKDKAPSLPVFPNKTNRKVFSRLESTTMDDPFMRNDISPTKAKETLLGIVEKTSSTDGSNSNSKRNSLTNSIISGNDAGEADGKVGLMSLEKMMCNLETEKNSGTFLPTSDSFKATKKAGSFTKKCGISAAAALVTAPSFARTEDIESLKLQRARNRKTLRRMDSKFVNGVTKNRRKLRDLIASEGIQTGAKIKKIVSSLIEAVGNYWIEARHLANLIHCFPLAGEDEVHTFGSYKVELVVMLFSRVVDIHNFDVVLSMLCNKEVGVLYCRLGWLNLFNPLKIEGAYDLDLSVYEQRLVCKAIILHAMAENGGNMTQGKFQWDRKDSAQAGWVITDNWLKDSGMPTKGFVSFVYMPTDSCSVGVSAAAAVAASGEKEKDRRAEERNWKDVLCPLQRALLAVVLIDERELRPELYEDAENMATIGDAYLTDNIDAWTAYLYPAQKAAASGGSTGNSANAKKNNNKSNKKK